MCARAHPCFTPGVYHDAWQSVATLAGRLQQAGVADAQGFALDVSNFRAQAAW